MKHKVKQKTVFVCKDMLEMQQSISIKPYCVLKENT